MSRIKRTTRRGYGRRTFLKQSAIAAAAASVMPKLARGQAAAAQPSEKLIFIFTGTGGASIVDSFMAVGENEVDAGLRDDMIVYPDAFITEHGTGPHRLRSLDLPQSYRDILGFATGNGYQQSTFLNRHLDDTCVMATECTSVNHLVAQHRSMTGANAHGGKSLGEAVAERYGQDLALPYVNMGKGGYLNPGTDEALSEYARAESVSQPIFFPLSGDGVRGLVGAPGADLVAAPQPGAQLNRARDLMDRARGVRDQLDDNSVFGQTFQCVNSRRDFLRAREQVSMFEDADMVSNLMLLRPEELDITPFGLETSPDVDFVRNIVETATPEGGASSVFVDAFHAQIAQAYLLAKGGYASSITLGPDLNPAPEVIGVNPPGSFDFSHQNHVAGQSVMWSRLLDGIDKLVQLLKATPTDDGTMWDRSLIYVATDFGRDKRRSEPGAPVQFGTSTAHHLNNGALLLSPLLNGGRVYGTVDPDTLLTSGFDRVTGEPDGSTLREGDVYSVICQALGVEFLGRQDIPAMVADA